MRVLLIEHLFMLVSAIGKEQNVIDIFTTGRSGESFPGLYDHPLNGLLLENLRHFDT